MIKKIFKYTILTSFLFFLISGSVFLWYKQSYSNIQNRYKSIHPQNVEFDVNGIPTISARNWNDVFYYQGYVHAAERLWQMDLTRRLAYGGLAEILGEGLIKYDKKQRVLDWGEVAHKAYENFDQNEKKICQRYSQGINDFIKKNTLWGIEYALLGLRPTKWSCKDSILILIYMANSLTSGIVPDTIAQSWSESIPRDWYDIIFPKKSYLSKFYSPKNNFHQIEPLKKKDLKLLETYSFDQKYLTKSIGSNAWAFSDEKNVFLASDPHLDQSVPQLMYANRLFVNNEKWAAGISIPGLPGLIIGLNPHFAWGLTNNGDDVDDLVEEDIDYKRKIYKVRSEEKKIKVKEFIIKVKNRPSVKHSGLFTDIGPLITSDLLDKRWFSRYWAGYRPKLYSFPFMKIIQAKTFDEFKEAFSTLKIPSQNILFADKKGHLGLFTIGVHFKRKSTGHKTVERSDFKEIPLVDKIEYLEKIETSKSYRFLSNANEALLNNDYGAYYEPDNRSHRINSLLNLTENHSLEGMKRIQLDTFGHYLKTFSAWLAEKNTLKNILYRNKINQLKSYSGDMNQNNSILVKELLLLDKIMEKTLTSKILHNYLPTKKLRYDWYLKSNWKYQLFTEEKFVELFGFKSRDLANFLIKILFIPSEKKKKLVDELRVLNTWQAQHPFVGNLPIIGGLFKIDEYLQSGSKYSVRMENPTYGAVSRFIADVKQPQNTLISLPVGQSGHVFSPFYKNLLEKWKRGDYIKLIDEKFARKINLISTD